MTIKKYAGDKVTGLSSDTKPTNIPDGATFYELDTGKSFVLYSATWTETKSTLANSAYAQANAAYNAANSIVSSGNSVPAFNQANLAYTQANAAYDKANSAVSSSAGPAYDQANIAYAQANAAYNAANAVVSSGAGPAYDQANTAFNKANSANVLAYNTGIGANAYAVSIGTAGNTYAMIYANGVANSANAYAASLSPDLTPVFVTANSAFDKANAANVLAYNTGIGANTWSNTQYTNALVSANNSANAANAYAASLTPDLTAVFVTANAAFDKANAANVLAYEVAIGANNWANTKLSNSTATLQGSLTVANNLIILQTLTSGNSTLTNLGTLTLGNGNFGQIDLKYGSVTPITFAAYNAYNSNLGLPGVSFLGIANVNGTHVTSDGLDTFAFRRSANTQTVRIYNTYTDSGNNEYAYMSWNVIANQFHIGVNAAGTGTNREVGIYGNQLYFKTGTTPTSRWFVDQSGHLKPLGDQTTDLGASVTYRIRNIYAGNVTLSGNITSGPISTTALLVNSVQVSGDAYANGVANSANAYAVTVGAASNNYANVSFTTVANGAAAFAKANANNGIGNSSNNQLLFNDSGISNGSTTLTFNKTTGTLNVSNINVTGTITYVSANSVTVGDSQITSVVALTVSATDQIIDSFANTDWRSAHYHVTLTSGTDYHTTQIALLQDGTNAYMTEYGTIFNANNLGTFAVTVSSGSVRLNVTPTFATTTIRMFRTTNK